MTTTGWIPLALSRDMEPGTSAGTVLERAEIVVWRDTAGHAHVWEDRCPHRGMKLSFGFVRGDHIACLYHGWEYDQTGQCRKIPAHPDLAVPSTICAATYPVAEAGGMIWTHAPLDATPAAPLAAPPADAEVTPLRSLSLDVPLSAALAALRETFGAPVQREGAMATLTVGAIALRIGLQPVDDSRCVLHITAQGQVDSADLVALLDPLQALRRLAETAPEPTA